MMDETRLSSSKNFTASLTHYQSNSTNASHLNWYDSSGSLGYGIGRLLRGAFENVWSLWRNWRRVEPLEAQINRQRQVMIFKKGLEELMRHLDTVLWTKLRSINKKLPN